MIHARRPPRGIGRRRLHSNEARGKKLRQQGPTIIFIDEWCWGWQGRLEGYGGWRIKVEADAKSVSVRVQRFGAFTGLQARARANFAG
jgi:hypothetical protein